MEQNIKIKKDAHHNLFAHIKNYISCKIFISTEYLKLRSDCLDQVNM